MSRVSYVMRNGELVEKKTSEPIAVPDGPLQAPTVISDTPDYRSPIDGRMISGRAARREDLKRNNCVEAGDSSLSPIKRKGDGFRNPRFAKKYGLPLSESVANG